MYLSLASENNTDTCNLLTAKSRSTSTKPINSHPIEIALYQSNFFHPDCNPSEDTNIRAFIWTPVMCMYVYYNRRVEAWVVHTTCMYAVTIAPMYLHPYDNHFLSLHDLSHPFYGAGY